MEGGRALADMLFGAVSPSGKLPFTVPTVEAHLPFFDAEADAIEYGPLHGYTLLEKEGREAAYPFGFGLSYAAFDYRSLKVRRTPSGLEVDVAVRNDGPIAADEVSQLYVGFPGTQVTRPHKLLKAFARARIEPGQTVVVRMQVGLEDLKWWDVATRSWLLEAGAHRVYVGGSSSAAERLSCSVMLG